MPTNCNAIKHIPVGAINPIRYCPIIYALITTVLEQFALSANGAKTGIDNTANPEEDWIKNPRKIKILTFIENN